MHLIRFDIRHDALRIFYGEIAFHRPPSGIAVHPVSIQKPYSRTSSWTGIRD
jgi:hypothetical protein